jgi:hypothetical protein
VIREIAALLGIQTDATPVVGLMSALDGAKGAIA